MSSARNSSGLGGEDPAEAGLAPERHVRRHGTRRVAGSYVIGENPANSEADQHRALKLLKGLDTLVVQDMLMTPTAELADVVFPAAAGWCESEAR